jgi:two-component system, NtrC family, response regulator AtoC
LYTKFLQRSRAPPGASGEISNEFDGPTSCTAAANKGAAAMQIVADRFVHMQDAWIDLATNTRVRLHACEAGTRGAQVAWSTRCAAQARLRHPLLNPLIDYGMLDAARRFEAYEAGRPVTAGGEAGARLQAHVARLCAAHAIALERPLAEFAVRPVIAGPGAARPLGLALQPRAALEAVRETLAATGPAGVCRVVVAGPVQSGLRTVALEAARAARLAGYVPVSAALLASTPTLAAALAGRHVCVFAWEDAAADLSPILAHLATSGGRRHVVLSFLRDAPPEEPAVRLEPMAVRALTAMIFADRDEPPAAAEILEAARTAGGRPGTMLERLGHVIAAPAPRSLPVLVRETAHAFSTAPHDARAGRRTTTVLLASVRRAERLVTRGRHAGAVRILERAVRVFRGRGHAEQAAECALVLGRLALDRGRAGGALDWFERARDLVPDGASGVRATLGVGEGCLLAVRLVDAEAAFRTSHLAAVGMRDETLAAEAAAGLAECLCLQDRADEAAALPPFQAPSSHAAHVRLGRVLIALTSADVPGAVRAAREGTAGARALRSDRLLARAQRLLGQALAAAGDIEQARAAFADGMAHAAAAHLPIERLRLHAAMLAVADAAAARRTIARLSSARRAAPRLVQFEIDIAICRNRGLPPDPHLRDQLEAHRIRRALPSGESHGTMAVLEDWLERTRVAPDDRTAIEQLCGDLGPRVRAATVLLVTAPPESRVLAQWGRAWPGEPHIAHRCAGSGQPAPPDPATVPAIAAEPVRFGGEVIGALACRWTPGVTLDPRQVSSLLRLATLAGAASVRALLDRSAPTAVSAAAGDLLGESDAARGLRDAVTRAARAPFPVLIEGQSGTGKELVARAVHRLSPRRDRRFCPLNCAALTDDLLEAELFGHARGAFTGAIGERAGLFEEADGGTLFLDEIGELSARAQAKLLRVLQDGEVRRVGENHPRRVDVRIVAATNRCLAEEVDAGRFRADLRFRLDVVRIEVPPLRERPGDVSLLAAHFWGDAAARVGSRATLSPEALAALARYDWPGNVRELQNVIAWIAVHSPARGRVGVTGLPAHVAHASMPKGGTFDAARLEFERRFVRAALATANNQRAAAAEALGMSRQGLVKMLKRLGIE